MERRQAKETAEGEGFEPPVPFGTPDFESGTIDHSDTPPGVLASARGAKELAEQSSAFVLEHARDHRRTVIHAGVFQQLIQGPHSASLPVRCTIDDLSHSALHDSPCTHNAGFQRDYEGRVVKSPVPNRAGRLPEGDDFRVGKRVMIHPTAIVTAANDGLVDHDHSANRDFSELHRGASQRERFAHPCFVPLCHAHCW